MVYLARLLLHLYDLCPRLFVDSCTGEQLTKSEPQGVLACSVAAAVGLLSAEPPPLPAVCVHTTCPHLLISHHLSAASTHTLDSASGVSGVAHKSVSARGGLWSLY